MFYERARYLVHRATREWVERSALEGATRAEPYTDRDGRVHPLHTTAEAGA
jgi:hypothetical protein